MSIRRDHSSFLPIVSGAVAFCVAAAITFCMAFIEHQWQREVISRHVAEYTEHYHSILVSALAENTMVLDSAEAMLHINPSPTPSDFQHALRPLLEKCNEIISVTLHPTNTQIAPLVAQGVSAPAGDSRLALQKALHPSDVRPLAQWSHISLQLDDKHLLHKLVTDDPLTMTRYAIRITGPGFPQKPVIFGNPIAFNNPDVLHKVPVLDQLWEFAAATDLSRLSSRWEMQIFVLIGLIGSAVLGLLVMLLMMQWQRMHRKATQDVLTRVFNRQRIQEIGEQEVIRAQRYDHPLSLVMIDLDNFKAINDQYGHLSGDQVLQKAAEQIEHAIRRCDLVGRFGGEEFIVVLPESGAEETAVVAERIRLSLCKTLAIDGYRIPVSASLGTSTLECNEQFQDLIRKADIALYEAKRGGRNRTVAFTSIVGPMDDSCRNTYSI